MEKPVGRPQQDQVVERISEELVSELGIFDKPLVVTNLIPVGGMHQLVL